MITKMYESNNISLWMNKINKREIFYIMKSGETVIWTPNFQYAKFMYNKMV